MKSVRFLYNPASGEGMVPALLDSMVEIHQKHGFALMPYRLTFSDQQDEEILSGMNPSIHHILVAGGDGTVNYVVNLLKQHDLDIPIALLPAGTSNDFATLFDISSDPLKACEQILTGYLRPIDLGLVNGRYFVNVFSCGLFSDISQKTPTIFKNTFGRLAYYVSGLGDLPKFRLMQLSVKSDGGDYEGPALMFFVFNGRTAGKLRIAYLSEVDDGLLDALIIKGDNPADTIKTMVHYLSLLRNTSEYPAGMVHIRFKQLTAETTTHDTTDVDGQAGPKFPISITCEKGAIRMLVPKQKTRKKR